MRLVDLFESTGVKMHFLGVEQCGKLGNFFRMTTLLCGGVGLWMEVKAFSSTKACKAF